MRRREFIGLIGGATAWPLAAHAQSKAIPKLAIIGSLGQLTVDALKAGLREFGWVDGETIAILGGPAATVEPEAVSNLVTQKVDVIFASGALAGRMAKDATSTIPIVCLTGDLVGAQLVESLAS